MRARILPAIVVAAALLAPGSALAARAYVTNPGTNNVSVIDDVTHTVVATIPVGSTPQGVAVSPDGARVYVANSGANTVSVIDTTTDTVVATITVWSQPSSVAITPDGSRLFVGNLGNLNMSVIDTATNTVIATNSSVHQPRSLAVTPDGTQVVSANGTSGSLQAFSTATGAVTHSMNLLGYQPYFVAIGPDGNSVYVTNPAANRTLEVDLAHDTIARTLTGVQFVAGMLFDPAGGGAWIASPSNHTVGRLDLPAGTVSATGVVGGGPYRIALSPTDGDLYVTDSTGTEVIVVDPATFAVVRRITVGMNPHSIVFWPPAQAPPPPPPPVPPPSLARPIVAGVSPASGPVAGGQRVTITGANFGSTRHVLFGDVPAADFQVVGYGTIVATTPAGAAGAVDVRVIGPGGDSRLAGSYAFEDTAPSVPTTAVLAPLTPASTDRPECVVPDVRGLTLARARTRLTAANCIVGATSRVRGRGDQRVVRQAIAPGTHKPYRWGVALALRPTTR